MTATFGARLARSVHGASIRFPLALVIVVALGLFAASVADAMTSAETSAVNWATARVGTTVDGDLCLTFVQNAYYAGGINIQNDTSGVSWNSNTDPEDVWGHNKTGTTGTGQPPEGALVFFDAKSGYDPEDYSHVTIMGANGEMISTSDAFQSGVHYETLAQEESSGAYANYVGWWLPDGTASSSSLTNGSFVQVSGSNSVYEIVGGAPMYVSNWANVGGSQPTTVLSQQAFNALNSVPSDGTLVSSGATGMVYEIAGGAPLYVSNFNNIGGARAVTTIDQWDLDNITNPAAHLNAVPSDGTLVSSGATGMVYEIAGGAPLYVSNFNNIGGARAVTTIDQWDLDNITNPAAHLNAVPSDGTLVSSGATGMVYEIAGGAPLYVSNFNNIGGARAVTTIDQWDLDNITNPAAHLNAVPSDGTVIRDYGNGTVYVVAGGAPIYVSSFTDIGGPRPFTNVDDWDLTNISNPAAHLNAVPADGTVVEGLPSATYWTFTDGTRSITAAVSGAITVDDAGLDAFPEPSKPTSGTGSSMPGTSGSGTTTSGSSGAPSGSANPTPTAGPSAGAGSPTSTAAPATHDVTKARCVVPSLRGLKLEAARKALLRAKCKLGAVKRSAHHRARGAMRVTSQSSPSRTSHVANFRVNVTLGYHRRVRQ